MPKVLISVELDSDSGQLRVGTNPSHVAGDPILLFGMLEGAKQVIASRLTNKPAEEQQKSKIIKPPPGSRLPPIDNGKRQ